jgi:hypothetical protein
MRKVLTNRIVSITVFLLAFTPTYLLLNFFSMNFVNILISLTLALFVSKNTHFEVN